MTRTVNRAGLDLIAEFEGFSPVLYNDPSPAKNCTIGYGYMVHEGPCDGRAEEVTWQAGITEEQGLTLLRDTVQAYADCVERTTYPPLTDNQFAALASLTYNIGQGGYINSIVRAAVNGGADVCAALRHYIYAAGVALPGLIRRREAECVLYMTPEDEMTQEQLERLANVERQVYAARQDLNALANGQDALPSLRGQLRYLWALAGRAWPF